MSRFELTCSPRLRFECLLADHADGLFRALCDPRVYEHINDAPSATAAELAARYAYMASGPPPQRSHERWLNYAVREQASAILIGRLEATIVGRRAEVAYMFGVQFWGQGYATEAMSAFQESLRRNEGVTELWATTTPQNTRSIRLLGKLGYMQLPDSWPPLLSYDDGDLVFMLK